MSDDVFGAFGLTTNSDNYAVDTGAGLVFKVRRTDNGVSTQSAGDLMSLIYNGVEYQDQSRGSQVNSGFDFLYAYTNLVNVSATVYGTNYIKITVVAGDPAGGQGVLTHYYLARNGYPHIYMATSFNLEPDTLGLCRYIVRIPSTLLSNGPPQSDIRNNTGAVESGDIFGMADGTTRSKHYSNMRLIDWSYIGATGNNVGVFMVRDSHEGDSGGPFYRSLLNQCGDDQEITYIVNYGEAQTEAFRTNILNGPYTLVFTGGGLPNTNIDYSWIDAGGLNLTNWIPSAGRGVVTGTVTGVPAGFQAVVGFANGQAQYWTVAGTNGSYVSPLMIPGTFTTTLYKQELAVATASATVTAGVTNTLNLTSSEATPTYLWKIGEWDGTPAGMLNADKMDIMHPSDVRMSNWLTSAFIVESNNASQFPCVQFRGTNSPGTIKFNLTAAQTNGLTLRIGTTCSYNGGRPQITVNSWSSSIPAAPPWSHTRNITIGTYRELNQLYTYSIPASAVVVGQNTLYINPVSGSSDSGPWLSASWPYDSIELDGTVVSAPTTPTGLVAIGGNAKVVLTWNGSPAAASYNIKRASVSGGSFVTIATGVKAPTYTDTSLVNGTTFYYVVSAVNPMGESSDSAVVSTAPLDLFAYWKFDESSGLVADDAIGTNNGTLASTSATWVTGKTNNAVHLNGTASSYVSFPAGVVSNLNDFTIATWVKVDTNNTWARLFDFGTGTGNYMFLAPASGGSSLRYAITTTSTGGEQQINNNAVLSTGVWHHVAVTLSGTNGILYLDGAAVGTNTSMTLRPSMLGNTTSNFLGKSQWSDPNFIGSIDDFRIYNRALSASEIGSLNNPSAPPAAPTNLVATAGGAQVNLRWNVNANAASYNVKRSTASNGVYSVVAAGVTVTNFSDTGVIGGSNYFYVVSALNFNGEGTNSVPASAMPFDFFGYWKLDESSGTTAADVTGARPATLASASATWVTGKFNNALHFNGTASSYATFPTGLVSALNDFTIATWVKVDTNNIWSRIFDFGTGTSNYMFLAPASGGNTVRYAITTSSGGGEEQINNNAILSTGVWHHVAVTLAGTIGTLYLDGAAVGTNSTMTLRPANLGNTTSNYLGKSQWPDPILNGSLDDFRIYNRALSSSEIISIALPPGIPTGLVATAGDAQVGLVWNAASGANSYLVKRATVSNGPYTTVTNVSALVFTNTGLSNGTLYYYVVSSTNTYGEGTNSAQVSVRPVSLLPAPLTPVAGNGQLQLSWPADHTGWRLQVQTNSIAHGLGTNWITVAGSTNANQSVFPINSTNPSVFFRLVYP